VFEAEGFWHPAGVLRRAGEFTRYDDITHLAASAGGLWLGTRRGAWLLRGRLFRAEAGPEALAREITARLAARPRGAEQLSRMAEIDRIAARRRVRATTVVAGLCLAVFALATWRAPFAHASAAFSTRLVGAGEWWRLLTANLLHAGPGHLLANVLGLLFLGALVERPLGTPRTIVVMIAAALGAMGASALVRSEDVVGASGVVFGLVGAALFLEFFRADRLPATLRIPRRVFVGALAADLALGAVVPFIAGSAHAGGLAAGFAAAALCARDRTLRRPAGLAVRGAAVAAGLALVAALASGAALVWGNPAALVRHGQRVLDLPGANPVHLNNVAWRIATEHPARPDQLEAAREMAERAVQETGRREPDFLDTLAELEWVTGDVDAALRTIDEAIALAPDEPYFREQRRRFTGERDPDDRPEPPAPEAPYRAPDLPGEPAPGEPGEEPGPEDRGEGVWI
jgi:membrane associated rhomboid family serine protease